MAQLACDVIKRFIRKARINQACGCHLFLLERSPLNDYYSARAKRPATANSTFKSARACLKFLAFLKSILSSAIAI
ncbi:hypothetical protein H6G91_24090 [Nostoc muscorum FACHB-395]|nr:hypothetical protein [Desmonostoc muscorum FACHB-395]